MAELWMGVHPKAPSKVRLGMELVPLDRYIAKNPAGVLGKSAAEKFADRLPFLFKVLAAGRPLSIQAHPDKSQAEAGYRRENHKGIPVDAFERNYRDENHKPEIICALTDFHAMRGFRPVDEIIEEFRFILSGTDTPIYIPEGGESELRPFFDSILSVPQEQVGGLISLALEKIQHLDEIRYEWVRKLSEHYPEDIGVLCPFFLNLIVLHRVSPGGRAPRLSARSRCRAHGKLGQRAPGRFDFKACSEAGTSRGADFPGRKTGYPEAPGGTDR
jgi:mannose-6-phosphate isomerase